MARGSRKVSVAVRTGQGEHVEQLTERPVRRMPDGVSGVVYGGRVYPINEGMFVCLDDPSVPKDDCDDFVGPSEDLVVLVETAAPSLLAVSRWAIESTRFGHYVVLDAAEEDAEELVRRLEASGTTVKRWAQSWRPASDGYHYDWFIRLGGDLTPDQCAAAVTDALDSSSAAPSAPPAEDAVALPQTHDALLRVELIVAQSQLETAR
ncbi:hypothetical protein [Kineococcus sp. NPDC059986]|uniref:hypothetical protein n=1 Tax=Kineococcus sp. NPDC059986 TaxID=3155538 RepID=UPI00344D10DD